MGRFSDAKANSDNPTVIRKALNYLAELLDRGYETKLTIAGKKIIISINPKDGMLITVNGDKVFGVDTDGNVFANRIANANDPEDYYGIIGNFSGGGAGLALFDEVINPGGAFMKVVGLVAPGNTIGGFALCDHNDYMRLYVDADGTFYYTGHNDVVRLSILPDGSFHARNVGDTKSVIEATPTYTQLAYPGATDHAIGVDSTGPYKVVSGVKTYL